MLAMYVHRLLKSSFTYAGASMSMRAVNFLFFPYYVHALTLTDFGVLDLYQAYSLFIITGVHTAASSAMLRFCAPYHYAESYGYALRSALGILLLMQGIMICIACMISFYVDSAWQGSVILVACIIVASSSFSLLLAYYRMHELHTRYCCALIVQNMLQIIVTLIGLQLRCGVYAFLYAQCISFLLFIPLFVYEFRDYLKHITIEKNHLTYGIGAMVAVLLAQTIFVSDRFLVLQYAGYSGAGIYGILWRFGNVMQSLFQALYDALPSLFFKAHDDANATPIMNGLLRSYAGIVVIVSCAVMIGVYGVLHCVMPAHMKILAPVVPVFIAFLVCMEMARLWSMPLLASGKMHRIICAVASALMVQLVMVRGVADYGLQAIILANFGIAVGYAAYLYRAQS